MAPKLTADVFKKELAFRAAKLEAITDMLPSGEPVVATVKVDGELEVWDIDVPAGVATLVNRNGNERVVAHISDDLINCLRLAGFQTARGAGELFAAGKNGRSLSFEKSISLIRGAKADKSQLRLAVFDIFSVDGIELWGAEPYSERFAMIYTIFGGCSSAFPVAGQVMENERDAFEALWKKHVLEEGFEGLVIRTNGAIKIKPVHTVDVVVIQEIEGKGRLNGLMGAMRVAFRDQQGRFLDAGKVGTGFTDADRALWTSTLLVPPGTKQGTKDPMVTPQFVIEVAAERFIQRPVQSWLWEGRKWKKGPKVPGAVLQKPRFVRRRSDKSLSPLDLRLEQVPGLGQLLIPDPKKDGEAFSEIIATLRGDLQRVTRKLGVPDADFEDLYQDTYVKAMAAYAKLKRAKKGVYPKGVPLPGQVALNWLVTVLYREWITQKRKSARQLKLLKELDVKAPERARRAKSRTNKPRRRRKAKR